MDDALIRTLKRAFQTPENPPAKSTGAVWHPATDVKVTPAEITVFADLPGIDEDEIEVEADAGWLRVRGTRDFDHDGEDAEEYVRVGRTYGPYMLSVELPDDAVTGGVTAKYRRGVLKVRVPRRSTTTQPSAGGASL